MEIVYTTALTALISSLIAAFVGAMVSKIKTTKRQREDAKKQREDAKKEAEDLKLMITQNTIMTCRMAIYDEHFSIDEKLDAYIIYRDRGGNHQTKTYMDKLVGGDVDEYLAKHERKD